MFWALVKCGEDILDSVISEDIVAKNLWDSAKQEKHSNTRDLDAIIKLINEYFDSKKYGIHIHFYMYDGENEWLIPLPSHPRYKNEIKQLWDAIENADNGGYGSRWNYIFEEPSESNKAAVRSSIWAIKNGVGLFRVNKTANGFNAGRG